MISGLLPKILFVAVSLLVFSGCSRDPVVARVNGEPITQKDLSYLLRHAGIKEGEKVEKAKSAHKAIEQELLNKLVDEKLTVQAAGKANIKADRNEIAEIYKNLAGTSKNEKEYLKKLREKGISKNMILRSIENELIVGKFKGSLSRNINIPENEIRDYYDRNLNAFTTAEQVRLSMIKLGSLEEAKKIKSEIEKGRSFEDVAMKYPAGHAEPGADTGWVTLDTFPADMVRQIRKIKQGSFGGPIKGREGFYLIKVQERRNRKVKPFEEVKENIRHALQEKQKEGIYQSWLQAEKAKAKIEILKK